MIRDKSQNGASGRDKEDLEEWSEIGLEPLKSTG
jgi:hypothetical protein